MQSISHTPGFIKKRKFLLVLPVLVLPFILILFFILGGGKAKTPAIGSDKQTGLNLQLPDAHFLKKRELNKLGLYEASNRDSDNRRMALRNDPNRPEAGKAARAGSEKDAVIKDIFEKTASKYPSEDLEMRKPLSNGDRNAEEKEKVLMERLNKLKEQLTRPAVVDSGYKMKAPRPPENHDPGISEQKERISEMMREISSKNEPDPEMSQLSKMLDKVMAIQHPEMVRDTASRLADHPSMIYAVRLNQDKAEPSSFGAASFSDTGEYIERNRFYNLDNDHGSDDNLANAIQAVIPENQTLVSGATIKVQTETDIRINSHVIPKGQLIYGICSTNNERLKIQFSSIRCGNMILPVALEVYDLDGLAGIFIPGSMSRDAVKQSGDQAINGLGLSTLDPSIGAQAASAGIQTAKTLLSRKVKLVKVSVKAGYQVLLRNEHK